MSPLSSSRLRLALGPEGLHGSLAAGWLRARTVARAQQGWPETVPLDGSLSGVPAAAIPEVFASLMAALGVTAPTRGATLDIEVANACAQFDVVEGVFAGHSEHELHAVANACVRELIGEGGEHEVRWQLQADERHLLICSIERPIVAALHAAARAEGLRLRRVEPAFCAGWSRHGERLRRGLGVFVCSDGAQALVAFVRDGIVEALSIGACHDGPDEPDPPAPGVDRLLNGLGLQSAATPTRLDAQAARLVTGLGLDMDQIEHFVAVVSGDEPHELSSRWMVYRDEEVAA